MELVTFATRVCASLEVQTMISMLEMEACRFLILTYASDKCRWRPQSLAQCW